MPVQAGPVHRLVVEWKKKGGEGEAWADAGAASEASSVDAYASIRGGDERSFYGGRECSKM